MTDDEFKAVLNHFDLSWSGYRKVRKGVKRHLLRAMGTWGCSTVRQWLDLCDVNPQAQHQCRLALAVHISRFFRDRRLWYVLQTHLLPGLCRWCGDTLRVWSAGCSRGEEIYSFKMLWLQLAKGGERLPRLDAWATDLDPLVLDMAREGVFRRSSLKEVGRELLGVYFDPVEEGAFRVRECLRAGIQWVRSDFLHDPPPCAETHLIFLRNNLLTYYDGEQVQESLGRIWKSLVVGGFLVTGSGERLPAGSWRALRSASDPHIYRKWAE
ncbi:chemotaxis protein methyltransferase CheR [Desulfacinum hydrothermale DSM 13146]|uniref:Chemotaxis protein methyltransferase CheR n=1 Tax=Desulfacinum hydrothermale DSM 13146 TaxID=1121390 RepID=A0A1W1XSJ1_9BACT|nr:CheR family methyltransferase [Desulfacinum hydrothermale]SMC26923.1 chemotaxis protein methyltransferase CheR [Desulfacinum hydrothermale DSM 13146]